MTVALEVEWEKVKAVIFDVDGTLYTQGKLRKKMAFSLLKHYALRPWSFRDLTVLHHFRKEREKKAGYQGGNLENAQYDWCAGKVNRPIAEIKKVVEQWMFAYPNQYLPTCMYLGVKEFFLALQGHQIKVAIYSDYKALDKLGAMGLEADLVVCSTDPEVDRLKPDPKGLLYAAERLGVEVGACLFIGDRQEMDGECAIRAGMPYLIVDKKPFDLFDFYKILKQQLLSNCNLKNHESNLYSADAAARPKDVVVPASFRDYVTIARPDHWFKNVFMLPGMLFAFIVYEPPLDLTLFIRILVGVVSTCLIASANYVINEYLDAEFDRYHPEKSKRTAVMRILNPRFVYTEYFFLAALGLALSSYISLQFLVLEAFLLFMGVMYNVRPFRTKERVYLDVLSESVNNPIRLALGWFIFVPAALLPASLLDPAWVIIPPSSIIVAYWMGGAFLMATKRFAEYRYINNPELAGLYRKSFKYYTENTLLITMFFYALTSSFFLGIFLVKNRIELLISFPFLALLFAWYMHIGLRKDSVVQGPEKLHKEKNFMLYVGFLCLLLMVLFFVDIPWLQWFLKQSF